MRIDWTKLRRELSAKHGAEKAAQAIEQLHVQIRANPIRATGKAITQRRPAIDWKGAHAALSRQAGILEATLIIKWLKEAWKTAKRLERETKAEPGGTRVSNQGVIVDSEGISSELYDKSFPRTLRLCFTRDEPISDLEMMSFRDIKGFFTPRQQQTGKWVSVIWIGGDHEL